MALSRIWSAFIIVAIVAALCSSILSPQGGTIFNRMVIGKSGDTSYSQLIDSTQLPAAAIAILANAKEAKVGEQKFVPATTPGQYLSYREQSADGIIATCETAVNFCIKLIGIMALFMGFMSIAEKAGGVQWLSRMITPFFSKLFPEVPKGHPAYGHMMLNFSANLLGLDNAATPFGIKSMQSLQTLNSSSTVASNPQIMFLCLHASGLTLIPISIFAARAARGAASPTDIFIPCMIATFAATVAAMIIVAIKQRINLLQPVVLLWIGSFSIVIGGLITYLSSLSRAGMENFSGVLSNGLILLIFILIVLGALYKKINVFDAFVEGAKGGFETAIKIIPYLVGMLVAISLLRNSGVFDILITGMKQFFAVLGFDTRFVDGLPTALIKPVSGSGARGMMIDTMKTYGADSFAGRLSCILQGSSDTTFYVIAVYFGAISIQNTRYAIGAMLLADLVGIVTSIGLCYLFFG
jgi:spore maturation protein SpmA